ncbi:uncharacterized protein LOC34624252 [Cyclospora cayetanensis]|uniref:Uncharacterized protein LOC34624252 n=1 Tax=Cyclospora cayetanensis TaxID=88456 RepID=A0A6P6RW22_9EIME|nr:uncharacterized protein LOC34624252 [Cyclospora cayetanensis]
MTAHTPQSLLSHHEHTSSGLWESFAKLAYHEREHILFKMQLYYPTFFNVLGLLQVAAMRDYPNELRGRIIAARSNALPLTPALYQELLQLEERLPIEPYAGVIGQPKPPAAPSKPDGATSSAVQETESQQTNGGMQFTNKPYMYTLVAFCVAFGVGYLYLPVIPAPDGLATATAAACWFFMQVARSEVGALQKRDSPVVITAACFFQAKDLPPRVNRNFISSCVCAGLGISQLVYPCALQGFVLNTPFEPVGFFDIPGTAHSDA